MAQALSGKDLAESAHLHAMHRARYRSGVTIDDLVRDLESAGIAIAGDDPWSTLRSALNGAQDRWVKGHDGDWIPVFQKQPVGTELSGRALSDAIYAFVQIRYPKDRVFHYEQAKEELLRTGVRIKGAATGPTMRAALAGSPDRFERAPSGVRGWWRWK